MCVNSCPSIAIQFVKYQNVVEPKCAPLEKPFVSQLLEKLRIYLNTNIQYIDGNLKKKSIGPLLKFQLISFQFYDCTAKKNHKFFVEQIK